MNTAMILAAGAQVMAETKKAGDAIGSVLGNIPPGFKAVVRLRASVELHAPAVPGLGAPPPLTISEGLTISAEPGQPPTIVPSLPGFSLGADKDLPALPGAGQE